MDANTPETVETVDSLKADVERLAWKAKKKLLESSNTFLDSYVDFRDPYFDDPSFIVANSGLENQVPLNYQNLARGEAIPFYLTEYGLQLIRDQSRHLCGCNEFALNAKENRSSYIVGEGFRYQATRRFDDPRTASNEAGAADPLCQAVQDVLDQFMDVNFWSELEQEIVERCDRDGEAFLRLFPQLDGMTLVREIEPEHVKTAYGYGSERKWLFGIETDEHDVQNVLAYWLMSDPLKGVADERVDADEIVHIKFNTDRNAKRGVPTFFPVRKNFDRADKLLRNMSMLAQIRATFALIRKHDGYSVSAVQAFVDSQVDASVNSNLTNRPQNFAFWQPGSVVDIPKNTEYEMPSVNTNAAELVEILNAELRAIAARLIMPEQMLTSNAADMAAYSAAAVAESPSVKNFQRLQRKFIRAFGGGAYTEASYGRKVGVMWRVIRNAVIAGRLPERVLREIEIQVEPPSLVMREMEKEAQRDQILNAAGVKSVQTWCMEQGLDYEKEQVNIEEFRDRHAMMGGGLELPGELIPEQHPRSPGIRYVDPSKAAKEQAA